MFDCLLQKYTFAGKNGQAITLPFPDFPKLCIFALIFMNRGALIVRAEIKPIEPDPGNAGEGIGISLKKEAFSPISL